MNTVYMHGCFFDCLSRVSAADAPLARRYDKHTRHRRHQRLTRQPPMPALHGSLERPSSETAAVPHTTTEHNTAPRRCPGQRNALFNALGMVYAMVSISIVGLSAPWHGPGSRFGAVDYRYNKSCMVTFCA